MSRHEWIATAVGQKQADSIVEAHRKRLRRWCGTPEGRAYVKMHNHRQYVKRKAAAAMLDDRGLSQQQVRKKPASVLRKPAAASPDAVLGKRPAAPVS
jgi:hypothetical protein